MTNSLDIPAPRIGIADPSTGLPSREWYLFFSAIVKQLGPGTTNAVTDEQTILGIAGDTPETVPYTIEQRLQFLETAVLFGNSPSPILKSGAFSPVVTFATPGDLTVAYGSQVGTFWAIEKMVFFKIALTFTPTFTTASGEMRLAGLPFKVHAAQAAGVGAIDSLAFPASCTFLAAEAVTGQQYVRLNGIGSGLAVAHVAATELTSGAPTQVLITGIYERSLT